VVRILLHDLWSGLEGESTVIDGRREADGGSAWLTWARLSLSVALDRRSLDDTTSQPNSKQSGRVTTSPHKVVPS
jgi:hypothetical protein